MKYLLSVIATLLLITGIPSCKPCRDVMSYFNINGFEVKNTVENTSGRAFTLNGGDTADFNKYHISCTFKVYYEVNNASPFLSPATAFASYSKCLPDGNKGSLEGMDSICVITKNDFNATHLTGYVINDLVTVADSGNTQIPLSEFVRKNREVIKNTTMDFYLAEKPIDNPLGHAFVVYVYLHNYESYMAITPTVYFK